MRVLVVFVCLMLAACGSATLHADPPQGGRENATPVPIDLTGWTTSVTGVGPHGEIKNGRLQLTLPATTQGDPHTTQIGVYVKGPCDLSGDFEITIHYTLITWPLTNGAWVGIGLDEGNVGRVSFAEGTDNNYATFLGGTITRVGTNDTSGSLQLSRTAGTFSSYYEKADGTWTKIASAPSNADLTAYYVQLWSDAKFGHRDVSATIDSVSVVGHKVNCS